MIFENVIIEQEDGEINLYENKCSQRYYYSFIANNSFIYFRLIFTNNKKY